MTAGVVGAVRWTDRAAWDRFVSCSPTGSIFARSSFLDTLDVEWEVWRTDESDEPIAAALVFRDSAGRIQPAPLPFTLYQGILLSPALAGMPAYRRVQQTLESVTGLLAGLEDQGRLSWCLHHAFPDLRPFSWFHYHEPALGRFEIEVRYTGLLPLDPAGGIAALVAASRGDRRRDYRKGTSQLVVTRSTSVDLLDELHDRTFARQGIVRSERERGLLRSITGRALAEGWGELLIASEASGRPVAATLFVFDRDTGYYLVAANDPEFRSAGTSTLMFLAGAERAAARGMRWVDVVGLNSPSRGDFKASFGAVPVPYHLVQWIRP
jgi:hypothetical protein